MSDHTKLIQCSVQLSPGKQVHESSWRLPDQRYLLTDMTLDELFGSKRSDYISNIHDMSPTQGHQGALGEYSRARLAAARQHRRGACRGTRVHDGSCDFQHRDGRTAPIHRATASDPASARGFWLRFRTLNFETSVSPLQRACRATLLRLPLHRPTSLLDFGIVSRRDAEGVSLFVTLLVHFGLHRFTGGSS